ncbi:aminotransferase class I/II-fold pyridoxal phosphate-dependent enzyme [Oharaeibacter diazotrophicus]|uniref:Aspartate/methionine/tyrosine aminotransferase n=1 Tax=Oharaeibacter diazotrophicus TaxID=1920512 RepID=A0A4R6RFH0_9HYPH|nr:aminotransferase class I/II-fold pyridoxal phosphate-dependent enzyme [Oharaeibacter diazotrophicus]TDP84406.1 aspartate/methionine/tyrosine aminotransferase [Oharaeibacter diazotrophicus]BBE73444.1 LL-diaminopimelate aminotransferase [Pleomorphomonas sp. SM30]GLS75235.1 aminotransferase [Oharaeibacter diazotrophicus]
MSPPPAPSAVASPFQRLAALLADVPPGRAPIDLTVGEPRHPVPDFVAPVLAAATADFGRYPPIRGTDAFRDAAAGWLERRYGLTTPIDRADGVLPLNGSREGLFYAAVEAVRAAAGAKGPRPAVLLPNPFYQVYAAGAEAAGAEAVMLPAGPETGFLPDLSAVDPALLARTVALFYASPANPQGAVADLSAWTALIEAARRHGFMLFADECYSEIWRGAAPPGVLEAADRTGAGFDRIVAFNSLSKRSNLPGLRCGFAAGDAAFLKRWATFRNVAAPQVPLPVQAVAVAALADEAHVAENRRLYDLKFAAAERILAPRFGAVTPPGGFFLWLDVATRGGGEAAAVRLWREAGVRTVPGAYLAATGPDGTNPGARYLRVAMVADLGPTEGALNRIAEVLA